MHVTVLAGGIGGARFVRGLRHHLGTSADITVIANTGDDIWMHGLRVCPDLDTLMYTLGGGISEERGWGREDETFTVKDELAAYGHGPDWFGLGDRDLATHLVRTQLLAEGLPLSAVTRRLCERWSPGVALLPMTDDVAETHVVVDDAGSPRTMHFEEWWVRHRAQIPAREFIVHGTPDPAPAPGVVESITDADVVLISPSNPVVSIGTILAIDGIRAALRETSASIVGLSPIIGNAPLRGMADACLAALGVETSAWGVADFYGARSRDGVIDGWLVHDTDAEQVPAIRDLGIEAAAVPLLMSDLDATARMAADALALARR